MNVDRYKSEPERIHFILEATKWLMQMGQLDRPEVRDALLINVFASSEKIRDVEFLIDMETQQLLIYLELKRWPNFFRRKINRDEVAQQVLDIIQDAVPVFDIRIVYNKAILEKAKEVSDRIKKGRSILKERL